MSEATKTQATKGDRRAGTGGHRLAAAFDVVSALPALAEARRRLIGACERTAYSPGELTDTIESDAAIAIAVMRTANNGTGPTGRVGGVSEAVESLPPEALRALAVELPTYDFLEQPGSGAERYERFRRHGVAVRNASERIGEIARLAKRDELAVAALLHDVGQLVLTELYGSEHTRVTAAASPDERARRERRELGIDHAVVGAVLIRRWGLRSGIASAIERHHAPDASGHAAAIRLADMVVHHADGDHVPPAALRDAGKALGLDAERLSALLFEFPHAGERRPRSSEPCPLSTRELDALRGLAEGKVYKQIAQELTLSVSTVRTHLHNVYRKIGAVDRAQAVLLARDRGWV